MNKSDSPAPKALSLDTPVQYIRGVGPARGQLFDSLGVRTVADLLDYFPRDYQWLPEPEKASRLREGTEVSLVGIVEAVDYLSFRRPPLFEITLADETGYCRVIWFNGSYLRGQITVGQALLVWGKVTRYKHQVQLTNPKFKVLPEGITPDIESLGGAVYPASADLTTGQIKYSIRQVLSDVPRLVEELYDDDFRKANNLIPRPQAYQLIHSAPSDEDISKARRRLKFDELFLMQLGLALRRYRMHNFASAPAMKHTGEIDSRIRKRFPFLLTEDQETVIKEIVADMAQPKPMNRLLQGDVGSGKTVVALYAALLAVANKCQVAIMAPTEILAGQHFASIERYLAGSRVRFAMLAGGMTAKKREALLADIESGSLDIVVGTHAVLQHDVRFARLGLVVIDEQHKFGVHQRAKVRKDACPHSLVMTATPIPRTLAMTAFGDLDCSIIQHCPPGRGEVVTRWVKHDDRAKACDFIRARLKAGKQAYFVYPRVLGEDVARAARPCPEDDTPFSAFASDVKAATEEYELLARKVFPEYKVALVHGQMPGEEKQRVMADFRAGRINVLVATVVIEVGVDVPNATIMVIEDADHFGLAQLHQLRGRIGRGQSKSYCFLFAQDETPEAKERLDVMIRTNDGFEIAEYDLKLRGPGEMFSTRQHGMPDFKLANIIDDMDLLLLARRCANEVIADDPMLARASHLVLRKHLLAKFGESLQLSDIA
jgi:ATP-dependent DNA helicase RecG